MDISIVIPVFNEEENVSILHGKLVSVLNKIGKKYEIIFVDDGSKDKTFVNLFNLKPVKIVRHRTNFGQTAAMLSGIRESKGRIIITMDGDLQNDPEDIPLNLFAILEKILFPKVSFLLALHPETTSNPSSIFSSNKGISSGSFCKSPSIVIIILPLLSLMPESIAAVCPKLVLCLTILTGFKLKRLTKVLSLLPSSTKIISYFFPILFKTETNFPCRILTFSSSLNTGITIEISIIF